MHPSTRELLALAWDQRRAAFDFPDPKRTEALAAVRLDLKRATALLGASADPVDTAHALHLQAHLETDLGNPDEAAALWTRAVDLLRAAGDPLQLAHKVRHLGDAEMDRGRLTDAARHYAEALALYRAHPDPGAGNIANAVQRAARVHERLGDMAAAQRLWREARDRYAELGIPAGVLEAERHLEALGG